MRLQELLEATAFQEKFLQEYDWNSPKQLIGWLKSKGFQQKGAGKFGAVYLRPGYKNLIKISMREDKCWLKFADWTLGVTHNANLPNIWWVRRYNDSKGHEFFIALVEKLTPFNKTAIMNTVDLTGLVYMYLYEPWFDRNGDFEDRFVKDGLIKADDTDYDTMRRRLFYWLRNAKDGKRFMLTLKSAENRATGGCDYDLHTGNLMYRPSDKKIVVIDPLADLAALGGGYSI